MAIYESIGVLAVSLFTLAYGAKFVVENAVKVSKYFGINEIAIGFILIAVATSLPELTVAVSSSISGNGNLSLGDVVGSNVTNLALVMGLVAVTGTVRKLNNKKIWTIVALLAISLIPIAFIIDGELSFVDGMSLIGLFFVFSYLVTKRNIVPNSNNGVSKKEAAKAFLIFAIAIIVVISSSDFVVKSAIELSNDLGLFQSFIGATIIALGTSVPELAVDLTAIRKRHSELAIGDLVGSNVTNLTLVLGVNTIINPFIPNLEFISTPIFFVLLVSSFIIYSMWNGKKITKTEGIALIGIYLMYLIAVTVTQLSIM